MGPLVHAVSALCRAIAPRLGQGSAADIDAIASRLATPLQVAVAGRVSSGKSTLVNALIGRRVAPTDVRECTRLVTHYRYGTADRVDLSLRDGTRRSLPLDADGAVPADLGVPIDGVARLECTLTSALLRDVTVIDTPGIGSADGTATPGDHASAAAASGAEAVLYVLTAAVRADDAEALAAFTRTTGDAGPAHVVAVLSKADTVPGGRRAAAELAQRLATALRPRVSAVLPVAGLLAETTESGTFTAADADALRALATLDGPARATLLAATDLFVELPAPVPPPERQRLLERLDLHGVARALELIDADPAVSPGGLRRGLLDASGFPDVRRRIDTAFRARADALKAAAALTALQAVPRDPRERDVLRDAVEALLATPAAHQLRLLATLTELTSGAVTLPDDLTAEVLRLAGPGSIAEQLGCHGAPPAELAAVALDRAGWWRSFAAGAPPPRARLAHVVHRAYFLRWQALRSQNFGERP